MGTVSFLSFRPASGRSTAPCWKNPPGQGGAESKQQEPRLVNTKAPKDSTRFVASVFLKIPSGARIQ
jgi:hypothetical protein